MERSDNLTPLNIVPSLHLQPLIQSQLEQTQNIDQENSIFSPHPPMTPSFDDDEGYTGKSRNA